RAVEAKHSNIRVIVNQANLGFAAANNQALASASGEHFVLLNNDTIVAQDWLTQLIRHLDDRQIGLVGPTTNRLGNEAEIETRYRTYGEYVAFATSVSHRRPHRLDIEIGSMFCLAMRR